MASNEYQELFDDLYDEVSDRYYELEEEPNSEALLITYHLGQVLQCAEYELISQWIQDGTYDTAKNLLAPVLNKGIEEGLSQLEPVLALFKEVDHLLTLTVYCSVCGGSGEVDYGYSVSGYGGESCAECLGSGMVNVRDSGVSAELFDKAGNEFNQSDAFQLKSAFGKLVLSYIPKEEHEALFNSAKMKRMFRK